jgi:hypothetical protein
MLESNLKDSFADFFETLDEEGCEVIAHNLENFSAPKIRVIDFC